MQDRQFRVLQERAQIVAGEMRPAADDAQIERLGDPEIAGEILRRHRLLEPIDVVILELAAHLDRDIGAPAHVDVDHDLDRGAERLAHAPHIGEIGVAIVNMRDLHLDRGEALRDVALRLLDHAVAAEAAEAAAAIDRDLGAEMPPQPMERQIGPLADRVPQRDVDRRDRHHPGRVGGAPELAPDRLDRGGVAPLEQRHHRLLEAHRDGAQRRRQHVEIAHAGDAACGLDLDHQDVARRRHLGLGEMRRVDPGHAERRHAHVCYRHVGHRPSS